MIKEEQNPYKLFKIIFDIFILISPFQYPVSFILFQVYWSEVSFLWEVKGQDYGFGIFHSLSVFFHSINAGFQRKFVFCTFYSQSRLMHIEIFEYETSHSTSKLNSKLCKIYLKAWSSLSPMTESINQSKGRQGSDETDGGFCFVFS